jgi:cation transport regulator ChaB
MANTGNPYKNEEEQENEKYSPTHEGNGINNSSTNGSSSRYNQGNPYHKDLRDQEENPEDGGFYNPNEDNAGDDNEAGGAKTSTKPKKGKDGEDRNSLRKSENSPLYSESDRDDGSRYQKLKGRAGGLLGNKFFLGGMVSASAIAAFIILLVVLFGLFKIPNLAQNITAYEFARVSRQFADSADRTSEEALAVESADDGTWAALHKQYGDLKDNTWGRLDQYRPSKTVEDLGETNDLQFNFKSSKYTGRQILQSVDIDGTTVEMEQVGGIAKWVPLLKQIQTVKNESNFVAELQPKIESALDANEAGPLLRLGVAYELREQLGISLKGLTLGLFKNDANDPEKALIDENKDKESFIDEGATEPDSAATEEIKDTDSAAESAEQQTLSSDSAVEAAINNDGVSPRVLTAIRNGISSDLTKDVLGYVNPIYGVATPLCIIYDGSVQQSKSSIDNQTAQEQSAYYFVSSAADQEEYGSNGTDVGSSSGSSTGSSSSTGGSSSSTSSSSDPSDIRDSELSTAVQAVNSDLGDNTEDSNAEIRATGGTVNTSGSISSEAGSSGGYYYSLFNALGLSGFTADLANGIVGNVCPILTNVGATAALTAVNIAAIAASGGAAKGGEEAAGNAASAFIKNIANNIVDKVLGDEAAESGVGKVVQLAGRAKTFIIKQGKFAVGTAGATELANIIVAARAGQMDNGLSQNTDLANEADAGANIQQSEVERSQLFGRPLLPSEVCQSNQEDQQALAFNESKQNAYNRYLNPSNAASLISRTSVIVGSTFNSSLGTSFMHIGADLLKPFSLLNPIENLFLGKSYAAPSNCNADSTDYGNVQFGYSQDEENLIHSSNSYLMLQNQQQLDEDSINGGEAAIAAKYAPCFGYKYNSGGDGNFDPTDPNSDLQLDSGPGGSASIGAILAAGDITRDDDGNVVDDPSALCSPSNLSYNDDAYGSEMVFRFRLAMEYDTTADQLSNEGGTLSGSSSSTTPVAE